VAYSLEAGLRDFFLSMVDKFDDVQTTALFEKLSAIEVKHQDRLLDEYSRLASASMDRDEFEEQRVAPQMEGGLSTDEYLAIYQPDMTVPREFISLAMAIEAQALGLCQRAADWAEMEENQNVS